MSTEPTQFTRESARRIAGVVRSAELTPLASRPLNFDRVDFSKSKVLRIGTFQNAWPAYTENTVTFKNVTNTPNTVTVQNLFFNIDFTPSFSPDCAIAKEGSAWYLVSVPLEASVGVSDISLSQQQVIATAQTAKLTFLGTGSTSTITFISGGSTSELTYIAAVIKTTAQATFLTSVKASLNTANCTISVTPETAKLDVVTDVYGTEDKVTILIDPESETAVSVSMSSTQTAVVLTKISPMTINVVNSFATTPVLKFGFH
jgi:hypothetical protein